MNPAQSVPRLRFHTWFGIIAAVCVLGFSGCAPADQPLRLQLNWVAEPEFGGFFAAQQQGLFEREGLDVELVQGGAGIPTAQLLASGKVDFAVLAASQMLELNEKGGDLVALFASFQGNPMGVMVHESAPWQSLEELWMSEATISFEEGLADFSWLSKRYPGGKRRIVPYSSNLALFAADEKLASQCFFTSEPVTLELQGTKTRVFMIGESGYDPYNVIVCARRDFVESHEGACDSLVRALAAGWSAYLANPGPVNDVMTGMNPAMSRKAMDRAEEVQRGLITNADTEQLGLGCMTAARWAQTIAQLREVGRLADSPDPARLFRWKNAPGSPR
ncbi:MAG: ABC transporter substrate-binding protein [Planctomycetota bacterium]